MHHYNHTLNSLGPEAHTRAWEGASDCASSLVWDAWIMTPPIIITLLQQIIMSQKQSLSRDELNERKSEIRRKLPPGGDRLSLPGRRLDWSFLSWRLWHYYFALVWCVWMIFVMLNVCLLSHHHCCRNSFHQTYLAVFCALQGSPSSCMFRVEITLAVLMTVFALCY